jgi:hypothetical protein
MLLGIPVVTWVFVGIVLIVAYVLLSFHRVGPSEVGLVLKRVSARKLSGDNVIAFQGEAGYQADKKPGADCRLQATGKPVKTS